MQDWLKSKSLLLSQSFVVVFAVLLAGLDLGGIRIVRWFSGLRNLTERQTIAFLLALYLCSVFGWILLWAMWRLLKNLRAARVFTEENVALLHRVSWCCAAAAAICAGSGFFYLPFLIAATAAGFMALIVWIIRNVFQKALDMKNELDLMI